MNGGVVIEARRGNAMAMQFLAVAIQRYEFNFAAAQIDADANVLRFDELGRDREWRHEKSVGKAGGIGGKKSGEVGDDFGANFADLVFRGIFIDFKFCEWNVVVEGDNRTVASILILHRSGLIERLAGTREICDADVQNKFGTGRGAAEKSAARVILRIGFGKDAADQDAAGWWCAGYAHGVEMIFLKCLHQSEIEKINHAARLLGRRIGFVEQAGGFGRSGLSCCD